MARVWQMKRNGLYRVKLDQGQIDTAYRVAWRRQTKAVLARRKTRGGLNSDFSNNTKRDVTIHQLGALTEIAVATLDGHPEFVPSEGVFKALDYKYVGVRGRHGCRRMLDLIVKPKDNPHWPLVLMWARNWEWTQFECRGWFRTWRAQNGDYPLDDKGNKGAPVYWVPYQKLNRLELPIDWDLMKQCDCAECLPAALTMPA